MRRVLVAAVTGAGLALVLAPGVASAASTQSPSVTPATDRANYTSVGKCLDGGGQPVNSPDDWTVVVCQGGQYDGYLIDPWA